jgi:hypothetical protein
MASHPVPPSATESTEKPLNYEQGWELLWSSEGSMKDLFPEEGGASGLLLKEREAWGE